MSGEIGDPWRRFLLGSKNLVSMCHERVQAVCPEGSRGFEEPTVIMTHVLGFVSESLEIICHQAELRRREVIVLPMARAVFELSLRTFWASNGRWHEWLLFDSRQRLKPADYAKSKPTLTDYVPSEAGLAALRKEAAESRGDLESIDHLLRMIDEEERKHPLFAALVDSNDSSVAWSQQVYLNVFSKFLHPGAHAQIMHIVRSTYPGEWSLVGTLMSIAAQWCCRAAHRAAKWEENSVLWAYHWIKTGKRDTSEPTPFGKLSYKSVGLPPIE